MKVILNIGTIFLLLHYYNCLSSGFLCNITGSSETLYPEHRKFILDKHNEYRSLVAKGNATTNNGTEFMASAKNMHKLVYDCNLEVVAQGWADGCRGLVHSDDSYRRAGENLFIIFGKGYNMRLEKALEWGIRVWFEELDEIGMNSNDTTFTKELHESGMGHFTQLAWGKTTHVGCGLTLCEKNDTMLISCNYRQKGNYFHQEIWEIGPPCQSDEECTTFANSTCDVEMGLCEVPLDFKPKLPRLRKTTTTTTTISTSTTTASTTTSIEETTTMPTTAAELNETEETGSNLDDMQELSTNDTQEPSTNDTLISTTTTSSLSSTEDEEIAEKNPENQGTNTTEALTTNVPKVDENIEEEKPKEKASTEPVTKIEKPKEEFKKAIESEDEKFLHEIATNFHGKPTLENTSTILVDQDTNSETSTTKISIFPSELNIHKHDHQDSNSKPHDEESKAKKQEDKTLDERENDTIAPEILEEVATITDNKKLKRSKNKNENIRNDLDSEGEIVKTKHFGVV